MNGRHNTKRCVTSNNNYYYSTMPKEKLVTSLTKRCVTKKNNDNNAQRQVGDKFNERTNVVIGNDALPKIILIPIERLEHTTS